MLVVFEVFVDVAACPQVGAYWRSERSGEARNADSHLPASALQHCDLSLTKRLDEVHIISCHSGSA